MDKKFSIVFTCSNCGAQFQKWIGRCLECGKWGTVEKNEISNIKNQNDETANAVPAKTVTLNEVEGKNLIRIKTGIDELDRVLGGGLVPGSVILLGGEPGIGKSTLALQIAALLSIVIPNAREGSLSNKKPDRDSSSAVGLARNDNAVLYLSGEESTAQIKLRAERLKINSPTLQLASDTNVDAIVATIEQIKPTLAIIDSIQTIFSEEVGGEAGGQAQVRACAAKLMGAAKSGATAIIIIGQVTKDGAVAGPKTLEHLVDTVLYLEGDKFHEFRILRAVKNRFGSTDEIGVFAMEENGLSEIKNPSAAFLSGRGEAVSGTAVTCVIEGSRPVLVEIQALVTKTNFGYPQRRASGFDLNRLQVLIGVLGRRAGLPLDAYDVFLNVVGGLAVDEPAADLAVILALASALKDKTLPEGLAAFGEVGLGGEVRPVNQSKKRLEEIKKLGFKFAVCPALPDNQKIPDLKIAVIKNVREVVEKIIK